MELKRRKKLSKDEKKVLKQQKEQERFERDEADREVARTVVPLFIQKARVKIGIAVVICFILGALNEFVFANKYDSSIFAVYCIITLITYITTRKEWKSAKSELNQ